MTPGGLSELRSKHTFPSCFEGCIAVFHDPRVWLAEGFANTEMFTKMRESGDIRFTIGCHPHFAAQMHGQVFIADTLQVFFALCLA